MGRRSHQRLPCNRVPHWSLTRSRKLVRTNEDVHRSGTSVHDTERRSSLNRNAQVQRRTSSVSSPRSDIRPEGTFNGFSRNLVPSQRSTKEQFEIPIERITCECIVCVTGKFLHQFDGIYSDTCIHIERTVCNSCVYENTKYLVEDSMIYYNDVTCPEPNCHGIFDYNGIREILLFIGKNNALFEQYDQHLIYRHLEKMPEFVWCAYECGSGQLYDFVASSNSIVTCVKCNRSTCFKHRVIWHTDMSCDQYDLLNSQPSETDTDNKWLELFTKQCPQCQWHIQKNEGCDHMTCRYCKYEFCWECLVHYKLIVDRGHSQHKTSCSHYQPDPSTSSTSPDHS